MRFAEVVGHGVQKNLLTRAVNEGRIAHAQLFLGPDGAGALPLAMAYIQYVLCNHKTEEDSCGTCPSCKKVIGLAHPDIHWIFPFVSDGSTDVCANHMEDFRKAVQKEPYMNLGDWLAFTGNGAKQPQINVATAHSIFHALSMKPYEAPVQVMMIWYPELLQVAAANKLLKIIEEPPADTLFILISANDDRILPTILSRTQLVKLSKINDFDMLTVLSGQYGVELERGRELVNMADGDFARAKRLVNMEDDHGAYLGFFQEWMRACYSGTFQHVVRLSDDFGKMGRDQQKAVVEYGLYLMRESLMFNSGADVLRITEKERHWLSRFAPVLTEDKLMATVEAMEKSVFHLARNAYAKLEFTALSLHIHRAFRQG